MFGAYYTTHLNRVSGSLSIERATIGLVMNLQVERRQEQRLGLNMKARFQMYWLRLYAL